MPETALRTGTAQRTHTTLRTQATALIGAPPAHDAGDAARRAWEPPDFTDVELGQEVTAYAGRW
ncbi:pyrroloquinoline quinone precursor peptide PqqA [Streptomyces sp. NPDC049555]|uniref:pyrroloquinoline quinone precursor peptide PqqA n=1 Tax=Streptomyces sp. NPDC049555 TaxID=3154930 RepID=UPI00343B6AD0